MCRGIFFARCKNDVSDCVFFVIVLNKPPVFFDSLEEMHPVLQGKSKQCLVVCDVNTQTHCLPIIRHLLPENILLFVMQPGESSKNIETCMAIWNVLHENHFQKSDVLIALGGGVVTDSAAFCASVYKRGISLLLIPTTIMAMCDAAIGGKNGVDFKGVKNILGSFYEPDHILVCLDFLASLPQREKINGYAEIIKSRILTGGDFSELGTPSFFSAHLPFLIRETAIHKTEITASDPYDKGIRQCLNFGHTIGHALESYSLTTPNPLLHGEAIAAGMIMEAYLSMKKFNLSEKWFNALLSTIHVYYLPIKAPHWHVLSHYIYHDKKNSGGQIRLSLMETTTNCAYGVLVSTQEVQLALSYYSQLYQ